MYLPPNIDWGQLLLNASIDVPSGAAEFSIVCPFHDDTIASCSINIDKGVWICFAGCGKGSLAYFLQRVLHLDQEELQLLLVQKDFNFDFNFFDDFFEVEDTLPEVALPDDFNPNKYPLWIFQRGFTKEVLQEWGCGSNQFGDLVIPIYDDSAKLVGTVTRRQNMTPKYLYSKGLKKSKVLFGSHKLQASSFICITEGTLDAMWLHQHGYPAVAILGMDVSSTQDLLLTKLPTSELVLCLDNDEAGRIGFNKVFNSLNDFLLTTFIKLPEECKDVQDIRSKNLLDNVLADRYYW